MESKVFVVLMESQVLKVNLDSLVDMVHLAYKDLLDHQVADKAHLDLLDRKDLEASVDNLDQKD